MLLGNTICYAMCSFGGIGFENEFLLIYRKDEMGTWLCPYDYLPYSMGKYTWVFSLSQL